MTNNLSQTNHHSIYQQIQFHYERIQIRKHHRQIDKVWFVRSKVNHLCKLKITVVLKQNPEEHLPIHSSKQRTFHLLLLFAVYLIKWPT